MVEQAIREVLGSQPPIGAELKITFLEDHLATVSNLLAMRQVNAVTCDARTSLRMGRIMSAAAWDDSRTIIVLVGYHFSEDAFIQLIGPAIEKLELVPALQKEVIRQKMQNAPLGKIYRLIFRESYRGFAAKLHFLLKNQTLTASPETHAKIRDVKTIECHTRDDRAFIVAIGAKFNVDKLMDLAFALEEVEGVDQL